MIETPRLRLRPFRASDVAAFVDYRSDPEIARFQSWHDDFDLEDGRRFIEAMLLETPFSRGRWYQLVIERKDTGEHAGDCAVQIDGDEPRLAQIGYTLARRHQGHGLATEAARALVSHLFLARGVHRVSAITDLRNAASIRVLERLGMRREALHVEASFYKGVWCDELVFAVLAREWPV
jgi:RimJ/RimL family protein N-acetyltransferase